MNSKKLFAAIVCTAITVFPVFAQEYHYQQGFATTTPSGWTRTSATTSSLNHTGETFEGANAAKFDATCIDETFYLRAPETPNAGILSFWAQRNANSTLMDLHIVKIVDGVETEIKSFDANAFPHKNTGWTKYVVVLDEQDPVAIKFYSTIRDGNLAWFAIDDIELTKYVGGGGGDDTLGGINKINTNFGDGSWGEIYQTQPAAGTFPTDTINGFILNRAAVTKYSGMACPTGITHVNRIFIDRSANSGYVILPLLKTVGEIEIHAQAGTLGNTFVLEEEIMSTWSPIGTYAPSKTTDSVFTVSVDKNSYTRLRISNNSGGGIQLYKLKTTTYQENQELNVVSTVPDEGGAVYYNLTHTITLNFNKEVDYGTGYIKINTDSVNVNMCTISGKEVTIPVTLTSTTSGKAYTLTVPAGAFVEQGNTSLLSNIKVLHFSTVKTVAYPSNYSSQIDVHYSTNDTAWQRMDIYYPTSSATKVPVLINMHGGGWNHGDKESQGGFSLYFDMGFAVCNVEYRMTATAKAPAAVEDIRCAMKYLLAHNDELNIDPMKIVFQGGSAGAHLALTAAYLQTDEKFDGGCIEFNEPYRVIAIIDKYGPTHLEEFMFYSSLVNWLDDKKDSIEFVRSISPALMVREDVTPATYIIHGDADPTVPYHQSELLADTLENNNVKYMFTTVPDGGHGGFPAQYNTQMNNEIVQFLSEVLAELPVDIENKSAVPNDKKHNVFIDNGVLNIVGGDILSVEIFDVNGRNIFYGNTNKIDMSRYGHGIYFVRIKTEKNTVVEKIVK
ncbi:MAG: alpha/beta hydrolase fold domain-containing protein [Bacteroidales bacterium]|jgi:acetyl esterase/lipase|nr:alpha/beta hydrolase fold domain-containing protein [Bacteroidales bacterium]